MELPTQTRKGIQPSELRKQRLQYILKMIDEQESFQYLNLVGLLVVKWGYREIVIKEMLRSLRNANLIKIEEGKVSKI